MKSQAGQSPHDRDARHMLWRELDRRAALKLFMSGIAASLASCGRPPEQIVPYVEVPDRETPGLPLQFASAVPLGGYGRGVIVSSIEGRPIKINGNPRGGGRRVGECDVCTWP